MNRPILAVCPPAPPHHLRRGPTPPTLESHGHPYAAFFHGGPWDRAVTAGTDPYGRFQTVVRGYYDDLLLPMCISAQSPPAIGAWGGRQITTHNYETLVLARGRAEWVYAEDGDVPAHAFPICQTNYGETAYSAHVYFKGHLVLGRLIPSEGVCVGTFEGKVVSTKGYHVLCIVQN